MGRLAMQQVEWDDVQGLVLTGYPRLPKAAYILWRMVPGEAQKAKQWLGNLAGRVKAAAPIGFEPEDKAINIALSEGALTKLGIDPQERARFSVEFLDGMAPLPPPQSTHTVSRRSSQLGDVGGNAPDGWLWGGPSRNTEIDGVLLVYAKEKALDELIDSECRLMTGVEVLHCADTSKPLILKAYSRGDRKEHFGFRDGISQPFIMGTPAANALSAKQARFDAVKPGEFILGYDGEREDSLGAKPAAGAAQRGRVPPRDLLRNGTYLVFRHLEQNVAAFEQFVADAAMKVHGKDDQPSREWVAARLIGRWRSGHPLVDPPFAEKENSSARRPRNDFLYHHEDRFGLACPIGSHIRRANPRDALGPDPDTSLRLSKMHRIIRRGRLYGPDGVRNGADNGENAQGTRGIYFICVNADIASQFELIQHTWLNNTHFGGLYDERDPLVNNRDGEGVMTIQQRPTNLRLEGLPRFVTVRGGAYFFMPGIAALRALGT